jgi:multimeric flavodoxin WrbA
MRIAIISASPKMSSDSVSRFIADAAAKRFDQKSLETVRLDVRQSMKNNGCVQAYSIMRDADALLFVFPLYFFCAPGLLMRFLQDYAEGQDGKRKKIYAIVNCGLSDPKLNSEVLRVMGRFAAYTGNIYRFGAAFDNGGMLEGAQNTPFVKKAMEAFNCAIDCMAEDVQQDKSMHQEDIYIALRFPRFAFVFMGNLMWRKLAKRNGLRRDDLRHAPYVQ